MSGLTVSALLLKIPGITFSAYLEIMSIIKIKHMTSFYVLDFYKAGMLMDIQNQVKRYF